jgi:type I restriction enzyme S subunit
MGSTAIVTEELVTNQTFIGIVPDPSRLTVDYLYYYFIAMQDELQARASGSIQQYLSRDEFLSLRLDLPDLAQQHRIADFLDNGVARIDKIIAARRAQVALIESTRLAAVRELTDGHEQAQGWSRPRVAHVFRTGSGSTPPSDRLDYYDGGVPWVNTGDVRDGPLTETARTVSEVALADFPTLVRYPPGSLVIAMYGQGATKGRTALLRTAACVNQACCVIQGDPLLLLWASHWFRAHKPDIVELANGAGQPNLSQDIIRNVRLTLPTPEKMRHLLKEIEVLEAASAGAQGAIELQVRRLQEYKQSLITAAVMGELDVAATSSGIPG